MIVYGIHAVTEAIRNSQGLIRNIFADKNRKSNFSEILRQLSGLKINWVPAAQIDRKCGKVKHQGIACEIEGFPYISVKEFLSTASNEDNVVLIADQLQDPHNLGAILRAMGAFGADLLVLNKRRSVKVTPAAIATSAGGAFAVPIARENSLSQVIEAFKTAGYWVFGMDPAGEKHLRQGDLTGDIALVLGSEGRGISKLVKQKCDALYRLPQQGNIQSLNAAMAAACALYEIVTQRSVKSG